MRLCFRQKPYLSTVIPQRSSWRNNYENAFSAAHKYVLPICDQHGREMREKRVWKRRVKYVAQSECTAHIWARGERLHFKKIQLILSACISLKKLFISSPSLIFFRLLCLAPVKHVFILHFLTCTTLISVATAFTSNTNMYVHILRSYTYIFFQCSYHVSANA